MNRRQFQAASEQARKRAVELGEAGDTAVVAELIALCGHAGPTVRRAAASVLGKLATDHAACAAVPALCKLARDPHPQVRQYAMLALGKIGDECALPALRDAANRPDGPDYVVAAALKAIEQVDAYVEYWGLDTTDYKIGMLLKQKLYQQEGKRLISLYPADLPHLDRKLGDALHTLAGGGRDERRESSPTEGRMPLPPVAVLKEQG